MFDSFEKRMNEKKKLFVLNQVVFNITLPMFRLIF